MLADCGVAVTAGRSPDGAGSYEDGEEDAAQSQEHKVGLNSGLAANDGICQKHCVAAGPDQPAVVTEIGRLLCQQLAHGAHCAPEDAGFDGRVRAGAPVRGCLMEFDKRQLSRLMVQGRGPSPPGRVRSRRLARFPDLRFARL